MKKLILVVSAMALAILACGGGAPSANTAAQRNPCTGALEYLTAADGIANGLATDSGAWLANPGYYADQYARAERAFRGLTPPPAFVESHNQAIAGLREVRLGLEAWDRGDVNATLSHMDRAVPLLEGAAELLEIASDQCK